MQKAVIIYSTTDGQTKRICEFLMQKLEKKMKIDMFSIDEIDKTELKFYDKIIVGASIRYGKHSPKLFKFIEENIDVLKAKFAAFFTTLFIFSPKVFTETVLISCNYSACGC